MKYNEAVENRRNEIHNAMATLTPQLAAKLRTRFGLIAEAEDPDEASLHEMARELVALKKAKKR